MSFNSFQNTIEQLNNAKDLAAETDFQDTLNQINDTANEQTSLFGDIEKAGASIGGVVVAGKTLKGMYSKFKGMLDKRKGKKEQPEEEEDNDEVGERAQVNEPTEGSSGGDIEMSGTITETPYTTASDDVATAGGDLSDRAGDFGEDAEPADLDLAPEPTEGLGEMEQPSFLQRTDATTEMPDELTEAVGDVGEEASSGLEGVIGSVRSALSTASDAVTGAVSDATSGVADAVSGATDAATDAVSAATETGAEVASSAEEVAGAALDAVPIIGPVLGMILEGVGIATAVGGVTAGVIGTGDAGSTQQTATTAAEKTLAQAKAMPTDVAGKFAVSAQSALQQFN